MASATERTSPAASGVRRRRLLAACGLLTAVAVLIAVLTASASLGPPAIDSPIVGKRAPTFDLETLEGGRVSLAGFRGSPVMLNFWASWCIPCRDEAPMLRAADEAYGPRGLHVLGVVYQDSAQNASNFMHEFELSYPGLLDPNGSTAIDYGVFGIPETFFVDASGVVRSRQWGPLTNDDLRAQIEAILP